MLNFVGEFYGLFYEFLQWITNNIQSSNIANIATLLSYLVVCIIMFSVFAVPFVLVVKLINFVCGGYNR